MKPLKSSKDEALNEFNETFPYTRTPRTPGRKPTLPNTFKNERRRAQKRISYHKCKTKPSNLAKKSTTIRRQEAEAVTLSSPDKVVPLLLPEKKIPLPSNLGNLLESPNQLQTTKAETSEKGIEESTNFRISAKFIGLTYPRVNANVTLESFFEALKTNSQVKRHKAEVLLSLEAHEDQSTTTPNHFHGLLVATENKFNIRNPKLLHVNVDNQAYKGHYKGGIGDPTSTIEYIKKEKNFVSTNNAFFKSLENKRDDVRELVAQGKFTREKAVEYIEINPKQAVGNIKTAVKAVETSDKIRKIRTERAVVPFTDRKLDEFNIPPSLEEWLNLPDPEKPVLILVGPSGTGKSQFVRAFAKHKNWKTKFVNTRDALKGVLPEHNLIVLEDYNFEETQEELLAFFMREQNVPIQHKIKLSFCKRRNFVRTSALSVQSASPASLLLLCTHPRPFVDPCKVHPCPFVSASFLQVTSFYTINKILCCDSLKLLS